MYLHLHSNKPGRRRPLEENIDEIDIESDEESTTSTLDWILVPLDESSSTEGSLPDFTGDTGPNMELVQEKQNPFSCLDYFLLYISGEILNQFVKATNSFGHLFVKRWKAMDLAEFKKFLGIIFLFGLVKFPTREITLESNIPFIFNKGTKDKVVRGHMDSNNTYIRTEIPCSSIVGLFNNIMVETDSCGQRMSSARPNIKTKSWIPKVLIHSFDPLFVVGRFQHLHRLQAKCQSQRFFVSSIYSESCFRFSAGGAR